MIAQIYYKPHLGYDMITKLGFPVSDPQTD
uniref:Uncharacterized protein n=1 Tax=Arundo donax TaxID=35708 RepID=A0A0A8Y828_ARUDO